MGTGVKIAVGFVIAGVTLVVLAMGAMVAGSFWLLGEVKKTLVTADTFQAIKVGESRSQVLGKLPEDGADPELAKQAPAAPKGTACEYYFAKGGESREGIPEPSHAYQFCFKGTELVAKKQFPIRKGSFI
jgi:hypothetical protein